MFSLLKSTFLSLLFFGSLYTTVFAQSGDITLQVSPQSPRPNSTITIKAVGSGTNLDFASFTWKVNNKVIKTGKGVTSIQTTSGKPGVTTNVAVDIEGADVGYVSRSISFRPIDVTLVYKTDGYVPPFYKGKSIETHGSSYTVTAIPEFFTTSGTRINPKTLGYTWKRNGVVDPDQSGYGKDRYVGGQTSYVRGEDEISVLVSDSTDSMSSSNTIKIEPKTSEVVFYENSPLYGILYENALSNKLYLQSEEISFHAATFDLSADKTGLTKASFDWNINGANVPEFKDKKDIVLRATGTKGGQTVIEFQAQHLEKLLQGARSSITIFQ